MLPGLEARGVEPGRGHTTLISDAVHKGKLFFVIIEVG